MKRPPAFMVYAATVLADRSFKLMSLAERGLRYTMDCECWINVTVPRDPVALARILGVDVGDVSSNLSERVLAHYNESEGQLTSPDLEAYRQDLADHYAKRSAAGRKGAAATHGKHSGNATTDVGNAAGNATADGRPALSQDQTRQDQTKPVFSVQPLPQEEEGEVVNGAGSLNSCGAESSPESIVR